MAIPNSWRWGLAKQRPRLSSQQQAIYRVKQAIEAARATNADESLNDVTGPPGVFAFERQVESALSELAVIQAAARNLAGLSDHDGYADPVLVAVIRRFPPSPGQDSLQHALSVIELLRRLADLRVGAAGIPLGPEQRAGRPAPQRMDPGPRAAVRAAMHCYFDLTGKAWGGWASRRPSGFRQAGSPREDHEFEIKGAAEYVTRLVRRAGIHSPLRDIKSFMDEYAKELRVLGRSPLIQDYQPK